MTLAAARVRVPRDAVEARAADAATPDLVVTRVEWLAQGSELRERLRLLDPTPLFMPTDRQGVDFVAPEGITDRPGGDVTRMFEPALAFPNERPTRDIARATPPQTPLAAASRTSESRWFDAMARRETGLAQAGPPEPVEVRGAGRMDVYRVGEGRRVATLELPADGILQKATWRPLELGVLINAAGMVSAPVVTSGSGVGEVDERVRLLASREWLPSLLLRPGSYRLVVGP